MEKEQTIRCGIESCVHCRPDHYCGLKEIIISSCGPKRGADVSIKEQSMCANFEERSRGFF